MRRNCPPTPTPCFGTKFHRRGSLLLEASVALGMTAMISLLLMKASLLSINGNQWNSMQTLSDAYMTKEVALAKRTPMSDVTASASLWPDASLGIPQTSTQVTMGKLAGGAPVTAQLTRFRINATTGSDTVAPLTVWRLHSILRYKISDKDYVKNISTLRVQ